MPDRFKETGYRTAKQDAITSCRPDIKYERFGDVDKIYLDAPDVMPANHEVFTPRPRRFIGKDGIMFILRDITQSYVVYLSISYHLSLML